MRRIRRARQVSFQLGLSLAFLGWLIFSIAPDARAQGKESDIPYIPGGGGKQQLDLFLAAGKGFPTVLFVHGGSLTEGDRKDAPYPQIGAAFQQAGMSCAVMSYRLAPANSWPAQPEDVAAAVAWLKQNIAARGGDSHKVFLVGHSSGALLSAVVSSDEKYLKKFGLNLKDVAGCVPMGSLLTNTLSFEGVPEERLRRAFENNPYLKIFGNLAAFQDSFPINHVNSRMPPFLILIAETERYQPPILASAEEFSTAARKVGARVEFEVLKDRTHMTTIEKMVNANDATLLRIAQFIKQTRH